MDQSWAKGAESIAGKELAQRLGLVALDLAAPGSGLVVVPLYVEDNPDNAAWCVANAEARLLVVENTRMAEALREAGSGVYAAG